MWTPLVVEWPQYVSRAHALRRTALAPGREEVAPACRGPLRAAAVVLPVVASDPVHDRQGRS
jgi:hypothetical protein